MAGTRTGCEAAEAQPAGARIREWKVTLQTTADKTNIRKLIYAAAIERRKIKFELIANFYVSIVGARIRRSSIS